MLDVPEVLIILLTTLLVVLWTRHWLLHHRGAQLGDSDLGRNRTSPRQPRADTLDTLAKPESQLTTYVPTTEHSQEL
jgi:hypothetical protein